MGGRVPGAGDATGAGLERAERMSKVANVSLADTLHHMCREEHMKETIASFQGRKERGVLRFLLLEGDAQLLLVHLGGSGGLLVQRALEPLRRTRLGAIDRRVKSALDGGAHVGAAQQLRSALARAWFQEHERFTTEENVTPSPTPPSLPPSRHLPHAPTAPPQQSHSQQGRMTGFSTFSQTSSEKARSARGIRTTISSDR